MGAPQYINIGHKLADYLYSHKSEIPAGINTNDIWILCDGYRIDDIENYSYEPYESEFEWKVRFKNSADEEKEYTYLIKYNALHQGQSGIVDAKLIN